MLAGETLAKAIEDVLGEFADSSLQNRVSEDVALRADIAGMRLFERPLVCIGAAQDPLFSEMRESDVVGPQMRMPTDWLDGAQSVVSYFFPMTERVRKSNREGSWASDEWFHARIEGQAFIIAAGKRLVEFLEGEGYRAECPSADAGFKAVFLDENNPAASFRSNWSERHVAFACGLGTFSLTKGLITEKGMAGRFGSVVTDAAIPASSRPYSDVYEYCTRCGTCARRCPGGAISFETGKDHVRCFEIMMQSKSLHPGYIGCGKCQVGVPCEAGIPIAQFLTSQVKQLRFGAMDAD